jgi:hypothetical protein
MSNSEQVLPKPPPGVEPRVLARINALFEHPKTIQKPSLKQHNTGDKKVPWWLNEMSSSDIEAEPPNSEEIHNEDEETNIKGFRLLPSTYSFDEENESSSEHDPLLPTISTHPSQTATTPNINGPNVIAQYTYPYDHSPSPPPETPADIPNPFPSLYSLIASLFAYIGAFLFDTEPPIVEHSAAHIKLQQSQIRVEVQVVEFDGPEQAEKLVGVVASLHVGDCVVPIMARPKRIREMLRADGVKDLAEDVYGREIKGALRMLGG